jgi:hypothetical protein
MILASAFIALYSTVVDGCRMAPAVVTITVYCMKLLQVTVVGTETRKTP